MACKCNEKAQPRIMRLSRRLLWLLQVSLRLLEQSLSENRDSIGSNATLPHQPLIGWHPMGIV